MFELANDAINELYAAALAGDTEQAKAIYEKYQKDLAEERFERYIDKDNHLSIINLIKNGQLLVDHKTRISGETLLMRAVDLFRFDEVRMLLAMGADVNAQDSNGTPVLTKLVEGKDTAFLSRIMGSYMPSSSERSLDVLKILLNYQPNIHLTNNAGQTVFEFFRVNQKDIRQDIFDEFMVYCEQYQDQQTLISNVVQTDEMGESQTLSF